MTTVVLQYFDGCPSWETTARHLFRIAEERSDLTIIHERIDSPEAAIARDFRGSPTVLINGVDPFVGEASRPVGLSCRVYQTEHGRAGSPTFAQLRKVIDAATRDHS